MQIWGYEKKKEKTDRHREREREEEIGVTFQNCLLASLPPTLFKILAPPGCSSTKVSILYTSLSIMM